MDLLSVSVTEMVEAIRNRNLSPRDLVEAHIQRMESVNPKLNALVAPRFEVARREADAASARIAAEGTADLPPLFGIPFTVKEFFRSEGLAWTGGVKRYTGRISDQDATIVRRLRAAGAILLGATNAPEGGLWMETYNSVYGRTHNPWDLRRTCGGSSGGEGALVASGASPLGIGSDVGGSIRIPAAFCGVVGHKPTGGRVPGTGHFPDGVGEVGKFMGFGPLVRRVRDVPLVLDLLSGPDGQDPECRPMDRVGDAWRGDLRGMRVIPIVGNDRTRVRPVMQEAVRSAARALESRGAVVEEHHFPLLKKAGDIWSAMLAEVTVHNYDHLLIGERMSLRREIPRFAAGKGNHSFAGLVMVGLERLLHVLPERFLKPLADQGRELQAQMEAAMGDNGVILFPPYSQPAPYHRQPWLHPFDFECTAIFNVMQFPVTVVPTGFSDKLLPVSVQVVASRRNDARTIQAAQVIEEELGGWKRAEP